MRRRWQPVRGFSFGIMAISDDGGIAWQTVQEQSG
jgi:hypothetical protein